MKSLIVSLYCFVAVVLLSSFLFAQDEKEKQDVHQFTILRNINTTSVKNQGKTVIAAKWPLAITKTSRWPRSWFRRGSGTPSRGEFSSGWNYW